MQPSSGAVRPFALGLAVILAAGESMSLGQKPERVSVSPHEIQDNDSASSGSYITPDGRYVVFQSAATLVSGDTNNLTEIYVRDRVTGTTARVSVPDPGVTGSPAQANASCTLGRSGVRYCSDDGRHVAFQSTASNLVNNDTNADDDVNGIDVFVRDRDLDGNGIYDEPGAGKTRTVRVGVSSTEGQWFKFSVGVDTWSGGCQNPSISADGRYVAFDCHGDPFSPGNDHGTVGRNIYRRDRDNENDGVYDEPGTQCVPIGPNVCVDIDQANTELASKLRCSCTGDQFDGFSHDPAISGDGRFVAFVTESEYLDHDQVGIAGFDDNNNSADVYVRDFGGSGESMRVSVDSSEGDNNNVAYGNPSLSHDGRYIAFTAGSSLLIPRAEDDNGTTDVYVRDRGSQIAGSYVFTLGTTVRASFGTFAGFGGANAFIQLDQSVESPFISPDGQDVAFITAENGVQCGLIAPCPDQNGKKDVYVRHLTPGEEWTYRATRTENSQDANGDSIFPSVSGGAKAVAFASVASNLVTPDANGTISDVYVSSQVIGSSPYITAAVSRKTHGAAGVFDVGLPLSGSTPGIEDRTAGITQLRVTFSEAVHYANDGDPVYLASDLIVDSFAVAGNEVIFNVHGAADESCGWFQVGDFVDTDGNPVDGLTTIYYRYLQGDINGVGSVNSGDVSSAKLFSGNTPDAILFRVDITADGELDAADIIRVKARLGNTVSPSCD